VRFQPLCKALAELVGVVGYIGRQHDGESSRVGHASMLARPARERSKKNEPRGEPRGFFISGS